MTLPLVAETVAPLFLDSPLAERAGVIGHILPAQRGGVIRIIDGIRSIFGVPRRDDPGDILREYEVPYDRTFGLAWDEGHNWMWGINPGPTRLFAIDPVNGEVTAEINVRRVMAGMFCLDGVIYIGGWRNNPNRIYRYDTEGNALEALESPVDLSDVYIASDGVFLFTNHVGDGVVNVFNMDGFDEVATIDYGAAIGDAQIWTIEWVSVHPQGQLWLCGQDHLYQCHIDRNWNAEVVQDFGTVAGSHCGIAHDGDNLWRGVDGGESRWYVIDDGIEECHWMKYTPVVGVTEGNGQSDVTVTIDTRGVLLGNYAADLTFDTNDPENPDVGVSVRMHVSRDFNPPSAFDLLQPADDDTLREAEVVFAWQQSIDPDPMDTLSYIFCAQVGDDSVAVALDDTTFATSLDSLEIEIPVDSEVEWWVLAVSGEDTVECNERFSFTFVSHSVEEARRMPLEFGLLGIAPNPFNALTRISYELPKASMVTIRVFDVTGRPVVTLVDGERQTGSYTAVWDGRAVTSGIYIVWMETGSFKAARKVMLVK